MKVMLPEKLLGRVTVMVLLSSWVWPLSGWVMLVMVGFGP